MSEYKERAKLWQEVSLWLIVRGFPHNRIYDIYDKLPNHLKSVLHKCICAPVQTTTDRQRGDLLRALLNVAGRDSADPLDHMATEDKDRFLSPLIAKEKDDYLSKR